MSIKINKEDLQTNKYKYVNKRDIGDKKYTGKLDRIKIDKDELYEVIYFIEEYINKYYNGIKDLKMIHQIEDIIHLKEYSNIQLREELIDTIITHLTNEFINKA